MSDIRKTVEVFYEGSADFLEWNDFWTFMEGKEIKGLVNVRDKIKEFPLPNALGRCPNRMPLHKIDTTRKVFERANYFTNLLEKPILTLIKEFGPFIYDNKVEVTKEDGKLKFTLVFAGGEVEGYVGCRKSLSGALSLDLNCNLVPPHFALETTDGIVFHGTEEGVILYDRHKRKAYTDSLSGILHHYS